MMRSVLYLHVPYAVSVSVCRKICDLACGCLHLQHCTTTFVKVSIQSIGRTFPKPIIEFHDLEQPNHCTSTLRPRAKSDGHCLTQALDSMLPVIFCVYYYIFGHVYFSLSMLGVSKLAGFWLSVLCISIFSLIAVTLDTDIVVLGVQNLPFGRPDAFI